MLNPYRYYKKPKPKRYYGFPYMFMGYPFYYYYPIPYVNPYRAYPNPRPRPKPKPYPYPKQKPNPQPRLKPTNPRLYGEEVGQWNSEIIYVGGDRVMYNGKMYQAKWWTQGNQPDKPVNNPWETPWKSVTDTPTPTEPSSDITEPTPIDSDIDYKEWNSTGTYVAGDRVIYDGKIYEAKWWTKNFRPNKMVPNAWETPWKEING